MEKKKKIIIGVTGGFCSGKSTFCGFFKGFGARVIDADTLAHEALEDRKIKKAIVSLFGKTALRNGRVYRRKIRGAVFSDSGLRDKLCALVHPLVLSRLSALIRKSGPMPVVADVPLLFESGYDKFVDTVILVSAKRRLQFKRAGLRKINRLDAARIIKAQLPLSKKRLKADFIIDNNGSLGDLRRKAAKVFKIITGKLNQQKGE